ncbi:hypothetical protein HOF56_02705 [Candidatus Peribacteria bacterium]|jgi:hypothetical protein|nr:hypothetical protein [Candidatus Peribacteria bacterium]MBT4020949.1 hypothetical protein [Candidatus Peribacteria bacterium]MBT4240299.1 hypothetical protein [Candidatus Peribacteria bacterium]MBT4473914.1 hypothetical protein [Candidatus Peribacteria bacterium]
MISWFIRHPLKTRTFAELSVEENMGVQTRLFADSEIAVHHEDFCTLNHRFYKSENQNKIKRFRELGETGGFVCAEYQAINKMIIGKIKPETKFECPKDFHFLKKLKIYGAKKVSPSMRIRLLAGAPRKNGLSKWHIIGDRIDYLIKGKTNEQWNWLLPFEKQTVCQEYLRKHFKLLYLLLPFGGNLEGVDIYGITEKSAKIYSVLSTKKKESKLREELSKLSVFDGVKVFFCSKESDISNLRREFDDIEFVYEETVWEWLGAARNRTYKHQLFAGL